MKLLLDVGSFHTRVHVSSDKAQVRFFLFCNITVGCAVSFVWRARLFSTRMVQPIAFEGAGRQACRVAKVSISPLWIVIASLVN